MSIDDLGATPPRHVLPFEAAPAELRQIRKAVRYHLEQWGASGVTDEAELVATELATNVIKHVGEGVPATLVIEARDGRLRVEAHDTSRTVPTLDAVCGEAECGRGLHMLVSLSEEWGTLLTATGKSVWCELSLEPARHHMRVRRGALVLEEYRRAAGTSTATMPASAVLEESATDAITDLLHWLVAQGGDPDATLERAWMHFEAETGVA